MWMREKLENTHEQKLIKRGKAVSVVEGMLISGEESLRAPEQASPYGYFAAIPAGQVVFSAEGKLIGIPMILPDKLEEGEVLLRAASGAEIWLKNDGSVVINGQIFERGGE